MAVTRWTAVSRSPGSPQEHTEHIGHPISPQTRGNLFSHALALSLDWKARWYSRNFCSKPRQQVRPGAVCAWHGPQAPARSRSGRGLGVDGDHLPAAAPDQKHPVEPLGQDLEELHIWGRRLRPQLTRRTCSTKLEESD